MAHKIRTAFLLCSALAASATTTAHARHLSTQEARVSAALELSETDNAGKTSAQEQADSTAAPASTDDCCAAPKQGDDCAPNQVHVPAGLEQFVASNLAVRQHAEAKPLIDVTVNRMDGSSVTLRDVRRDADLRGIKELYASQFPEQLRQCRGYTPATELRFSEFYAEFADDDGEKIETSAKPFAGSSGGDMVLFAIPRERDENLIDVTVNHADGKPVTFCDVRRDSDLRGIKQLYERQFGDELRQRRGYSAQVELQLTDFFLAWSGTDGEVIDTFAKPFAGSTGWDVELYARPREPTCRMDTVDI